MTGNAVAPERTRVGLKATNRPLEESVELIVVAAGGINLRCLRLPERKIVIFRPAGGDETEGEILKVLPRKEWRFGKTDYISGEIVDSYIDGVVLSPVPLKLYDRGLWDPQGDFISLWEENGSSTGDELPAWVQAVLQAGKRRQFEMQQVIPGANLDEMTDPIVDAVEYAHAGDFDAAFTILQKCLEADLRCIDAFAHLGKYYLGDGQSEWWTRKASKCYRAGVAVGERALPPGFDGLLPWGWIDNRPFLRALHGLGLCQWRLGDFAAARKTFWRLLMLSPYDNLGVRFLIDDVQAGRDYLTWKSEQGDAWQ